MLDASIGSAQTTEDDAVERVADFQSWVERTQGAVPASVKRRRPLLLDPSCTPVAEREGRQAAHDFSRRARQSCRIHPWSRSGCGLDRPPFPNRQRYRILAVPEVDGAATVVDRHLLQASEAEGSGDALVFSPEKLIAQLAEEDGDATVMMPRTQRRPKRTRDGGAVKARDSTVPQTLVSDRVNEESHAWGRTGRRGRQVRCADTRGRPLLQRLRRLDQSRWPLSLTPTSPRATVVDLATDAFPITTIEWFGAYVRSILASRWLVSSATQSVWRRPRRTHTRPPFRRGDFQLPVLAGERIRLLRAQRLETVRRTCRDGASAAHRSDRRGGLVVEGTCDPQGRTMVVAPFGAETSRCTARVCCLLRA